MCRPALFLLGWEESIGVKSVDLLATIYLLGTVLDIAAVLVINAPWLLLYFLPIRRRWYAMMLKVIFLLVNGMMIFLSLCDTAFYHYANRRLSISMLKEFAGDTNLHNIFLAELPDSWPLALLFVVMIAVLWIGYRRPVYVRSGRNLVVWGVLGAAVVLSCCGRCIVNPFGDLDEDYIGARVGNTRQVDFVVNTPFKIYFSSKKQEMAIPEYFSADELDRIFPILHRPDTARVASKRNVMVIIVESLSQALVDRKRTPFIDSLWRESARFARSYANGSISIDAMPALFSSIPKMKNPFVISHAGNSGIPSLPRELGSWGYSTAFFHGGNNASMGFQAFARSIGFEKYYGRDEYNADSRFGADRDFDGTWAVWDERFLQFTALAMSELQQPFLVGVFTATSHHPYAVPRDFSPTNGGDKRQKMERAINYTDFALRQFFATARKQPWYDNTIFVITADHVNPISKRGRHGTKRYAGLKHIEIPIFIFDPRREVEPTLHDGIIQQIDIMPTVLAILGYDREFISLGKNALDPNQPQWAFNCIRFPQYIEGDMVMNMNNSGRVSIHDMAQREGGQHDAPSAVDPEISNRLEARAKALMQRYKHLTD